MGGPFVPGETTTRDKRTFCPGWWLHPGQKGLLGGPGKFPARGPPLVPGRSTTRDKRGRFPSCPSNVMFVFVSFYFSFKIGFHLLIQLIKLWFKKLWNKISYLYINLIYATKIINFHSSDWVNEISNFFKSYLLFWPCKNILGEQIFSNCCFSTESGFYHDINV